MKVVFIADIVNYVVDIDTLTGETKTTVSLSNVADPIVWTKLESEE